MRLFLQISVIALGSLALASCSKPAATPDAAPPSAAAADAAKGDANGNSVQDIAAPPMALAYAFAFGLQAPGREIRILMNAHEDACRDAGPSVCRVTGSHLATPDMGDPSGHLSMKAAPDWVDRFSRRLDADASSVGGKVTFADTSSQDVSGALIDNDPANTIKAQQGLRDHLQSRLERHGGVSTAKALVDAQAALNATRTETAAAARQVAFSDVTVDYEPAGAPVAWLTMAIGVLIAGATGLWATTRRRAKPAAA